MRHTATLLVGVACALACSGCDVEQNVRRAVSDGDAKKRRGEGLEQPKSSAPTEAEPNGSIAQATAITLDEELRGVLGAIADAGDVDWFAVTGSNPVGESLEVRVEPKSAALDAVALLSMGEGTEPLVYDVAGPGQPEVIPGAWFATGGVRLGVRAKAGSGDYAVRWKRLMSASPMEREPNDAPAAATELRAPGAISGVCDRPGDVDLIRVVPSTEGAVALEVTAPRDRALEAHVGADPKAPLATLNVAAGQRASAPALALTDGALVSITCADGLYSREHGWSVKVSAPLELPEGVLGEVEPNDSIDRAQPITAGARVLGYWGGPEDQDRFALTVAPPGAAPAPVKTPPAAPAEGAPAAPGDAAKPAAAGSTNGAKAPPAAPAGLPPKELGDALPAEDRDAVVRAVLGEDADEAASAPAAPVAKVITPTYAFMDKPRSSSLAVSVTPRVKDAKVAVSWERDGALGAEARSLTPGATAELCMGAVSPGTYVFTTRALGVPDRGDHTGPDYELVVEDRSSGGGEVEPNEDPKHADPFDADGEATGAIASAKDVDVFAFVVAAAQGERKDVTLSVGPHPNNPQVLIRDEDGIGVGRVVTSAAGRAYTGELIAGVYFVEVRADRGSCAPYTLSVQVR
jgi:hypothetical protein